ncbi:MAG: MFS transporter [Pyrinomonadaceae bacterium]
MAVGAGQAVAFPATSRSVANWFQERERGTVTAIYLTGVRFGTASISLIGAYFLAGDDWTLFFVVVGLVPLVWLLPWMKFLGKWETAASVSGDGAKRVGTNDISFWAGLALLKHRSVLGIFLGFFAYDYAWFVFILGCRATWCWNADFRHARWASTAPFLTSRCQSSSCFRASSATGSLGAANEIAVRKIFIVIGLITCCLIVPAGLVADKITAVAAHAGAVRLGCFAEHVDAHASRV